MFLAKSLIHFVRDYQFTVSFLPPELLRCIPAVLTTHVQIKQGIRCNFYDQLGGRSRFWSEE